MKIFTILDLKADVFSNPTVSPSVAAFVRDVAMTLKSPPPQPSAFHEHPQDFKLYCAGEFNTDTGIITPNEPLEFIGSASDFVSPVASAA